MGRGKKRSPGRHASLRRNRVEGDSLITQTVHSRLDQLEEAYQNQVLETDRVIDELYTTTDGTAITEPVLIESQVPHWHYQEALQQHPEKIGQPPEQEAELLPDGGERTQYFWYDPDTGAAMFEATANGEQADILFDTVDEASRFLERKASENGEDSYTNLRLYRVRRESRYEEMEGVEAFSEQAGLMDF